MMNAKERARIKKILAKDALPRRPIAEAIRKEAKRRGLSRDNLGKLVNDAASQMSRLMTGHDVEFSADRLVHHVVCLGGVVDVTVRLPKRGPYRRGRCRVRVVRA